MTETIGIVDLGSNSVRLSIVRLNAERAAQVVTEAKSAVRLADCVGSDGDISSEGLSRTLSVLQEFLRIGKSYDVSQYIAVATAATRQAKNGAEFVRTISDATGIPFENVSEAEESELAFSGASNTLAEPEGVLADLGGASIELVRFSGRRITTATSLPFGAVNLTARFLPGGDGNSSSYAALNRFLRENLAAIPWIHSARGLPLIGVGGTVRNLARIDQRARDYPLNVLHNYRMLPETVDAIYRLVRSKEPRDRKKIPGLSGDRADIISAGAAMISQVLTVTGARELVVSGAGVREGLLYRHLLPGTSPPLVPDVLDYSVANMVRTAGLDERRSGATVRLSQALFDGLQELHGLAGWARRCLTAAAALGELGRLVNLYGQDRHTFYLLTQGRLYGLTHREIIIAGFVAAYKGAGKSRTMLSPYAQMMLPGDDDIVRRLGLMVIAARQMTHCDPEAIRTLDVECSGSTVRLKLMAASEISGVIEGLTSLAFDFRKAFGAKLFISCVRNRPEAW